MYYHSRNIGCLFVMSAKHESFFYKKLLIPTRRYFPFLIDPTISNGVICFDQI